MNKVVVEIKRNWLGKPVRVEVYLEAATTEPERKPIMEVLEAASIVFGSSGSRLVD